MSRSSASLRPSSFQASNRLIALSNLPAIFFGLNVEQLDMSKSVNWLAFGVPEGHLNLPFASTINPRPTARAKSIR